MIIVRSINALREKLGWTQVEMATRTRLSQSMISKYEGGHHIPGWSKTLFVDVAKVYGYKLMLKGKGGA